MGSVCAHPPTEVLDATLSEPPYRVSLAPPHAVAAAKPSRKDTKCALMGPAAARTITVDAGLALPGRAPVRGTERARASARERRGREERLAASSAVRAQRAHGPAFVPEHAATHAAGGAARPGGARLAQVLRRGSAALGNPALPCICVHAARGEGGGGIVDKINITAARGVRPAPRIVRRARGWHCAGPTRHFHRPPPHPEP
jgi:hypothetical protein